MPFLASILASPKWLALIGVGLVLAFAGVQTARLDHAKGDLKLARGQLASLHAQEAAAAAKSQRVAVSQAKLTKAASEAQTAAQGHIRTVTQIIREKIHDAIPAGSDPLLSVGWLRLHDAAAFGVPPAPPASLGVDAGPSGAHASDALNIVVTNYGACHANAAELQGLQDWLTGVLKAQDTP